MCIKIVISTFAIVIDLKKRNYKYIFTLNQSNLTRCTLRKCNSIRISFISFLLLDGTQAMKAFLILRRVRSILKKYSFGNR